MCQDELDGLYINLYNRTTLESWFTLNVALRLRLRQQRNVHQFLHLLILRKMSVHVRIFITTSCCIRLKHMAINAIPSIRYIEHSMKLSSMTVPELVRNPVKVPVLGLVPVPRLVSVPGPVMLLPGTKSPNPMVLRDMKQKYDPSKNSHDSHFENSMAPPDTYLGRKINKQQY